MEIPRLFITQHLQFDILLSLKRKMKIGKSGEKIPEKNVKQKKPSRRKKKNEEKDAKKQVGGFGNGWEHGYLIFFR